MLTLGIVDRRPLRRRLLMIRAEIQIRDRIDRSIARSEDRVLLRLNGKLVTNNVADHEGLEDGASFNLTTANQLVDIHLEWAENTGET
jgi:hypothetical protein